jgi:hypothetical protein
VDFIFKVKELYLKILQKYFICYHLVYLSATVRVDPNTSGTNLLNGGGGDLEIECALVI